MVTAMPMAVSSHWWRSPPPATITSSVCTPTRICNCAASVRTSPRSSRSRARCMDNAASTARSGSSSWAEVAPKNATRPSPRNWLTSPPKRLISDSRLCRMRCICSTQPSVPIFSSRFVESVRSVRTTVTTRRSPSSGGVTDGSSGSASVAGRGTGALVRRGAGSRLRRVPHIPQNRKLSGLAKPHSEQVFVRRVPHEPQKRRLGGFSKPQFGQFMSNLTITKNRRVRYDRTRLGNLRAAGQSLLEGIQRAAEPFGKLLQNDHRHFRVLAQCCDEVPARQRKALRRLSRNDRRRPQAIVQEGELAEEIGGAKCIDRDFFAIRSMAKGFRLAFHDDKEALPAMPLGDDRLPGGILALYHALRQVLQVAVVQAMEQRYILKKANSSFCVVHVLAFSVRPLKV